jgi:hypothetical protein
MQVTEAEADGAAPATTASVQAPASRCANAATISGASAARHWWMLFLVLVCGVARADSLDDKWSVSLGAFLLTTDTTVRVDTGGTQGTPIDLERNLGLGNRTSFRADGYWRFLSRHKLRLMFFDQARTAARTISQQIVFNGKTYAVDTQLDSRFDTQIAEVAYEYAFLRGEHYELSASAGLHDLGFRLSLSAVGNNANVSGTTRADANGPLPVVGLHYLWQFTPQWNLDALAQAFKIKVNPYEGDLEDYNVSVVYMPWKDFGAGLGWNEFITHLNVDSSSFDGRLSWRYGGARLFVRMSF